jgi:hypothetical protein
VSVNAATAAGRAEAERLMVDWCTINRPSSGGSFSAITGQWTPSAGTLVYEGKCRVKPRDNADRVVQFGQEATTLLPYVVSIPMVATGVKVDDVITVTDCDLDPDVLTKTLRVRQTLAGSHLTARRLSCEVNEG